MFACPQTSKANNVIRSVATSIAFTHTHTHPSLRSTLTHTGTPAAQAYYTTTTTAAHSRCMYVHVYSNSHHTGPFQILTREPLYFPYLSHFLAEYHRKL